ncbi:hypothetical protein N7539_004398 [Penicillium diatomitis]|uniref:Uncharacterized protein n=1 Tax=Penicillium diatomitis TaxID=2819901 RepID=A0A9X0BYL1_9EURO|nr:uncharacterized protein N7539_004398 [Penicillium diatomitis]KAJ5489508.1 hypothetical protein N7539_004398 [Penicillium diatomitis]
MVDGRFGTTERMRDFVGAGRWNQTSRKGSGTGEMQKGGRSVASDHEIRRRAKEREIETASMPDGRVQVWQQISIHRGPTGGPRRNPLHDEQRWRQRVGRTATIYYYSVSSVSPLRFRTRQKPITSDVSVCGMGPRGYKKMEISTLLRSRDVNSRTFISLSSFLAASFFSVTQPPARFDLRNKPTRAKRLENAE